MQSAARTHNRSTQPPLGERQKSVKWLGKASGRKKSLTRNMRSKQIEEVGAALLAQGTAHGRPGGGEGMWCSRE